MKLRLKPSAGRAAAGVASGWRCNRSAQHRVLSAEWRDTSNAQTFIQTGLSTPPVSSSALIVDDGMRKIILAAMISLIPTWAGAETLGRWCSHAPGTVYSFDSVITIENDDPSSWKMQHEFPKSTYVGHLDRVNDTTFLSDNEIDGYRLLLDGNLEIFDDMGTVSIAHPWSVDMPASACWR